MSSLRKDWRRGWDSNPRYGCPYAAFRVRYNRPLCHLSGLVTRRRTARSIYRKDRLQTRAWPPRPAYCDPAIPAFFTMSPQRAISAATKRRSSSGGGDCTGRRPSRVSSARTSRIVDDGPHLPVELLDDVGRRAGRRHQHEPGHRVEILEPDLGQRRAPRGSPRCARPWSRRACGACRPAPAAARTGSG